MKSGRTSAVSGSRLKLLALFVLFLLPVAAAYVLYFGGWRSAGTINYGELVQPPRPVADVALSTVDGWPLSYHRLRGKWTLVYLAPADCAATCTEDLRTMRNAHLAQGREMERVQRVLVVADSVEPERMAELITQDPRLMVLRASPAAFRELASTFAAETSTPGTPGRVYLVDPMGNLVLSYPPGADPSGIRKDLARLLRVSQVG